MTGYMSETHYIYPNGDEVSNFEIVYLCSEQEGEPKMQDGEIEELRFFSNSVYTLFKEIVLPHWKFPAQHRKLLG